MRALTPLRTWTRLRAREHLHPLDVGFPFGPFGPTAVGTDPITTTTTTQTQAARERGKGLLSMRAYYVPTSLTHASRLRMPSFSHTGFKALSPDSSR